MQHSTTITRTETEPGTMRAPAGMGHGDMILRQAIAACGVSGTTAQDQIDCADAAFALGYRQIARLLYDAVFLRTGFSPSSLPSWKRIAGRTGLWTDAVTAALPPTTGTSFALDVAIDRLRELTNIEAELPPPTPDEDEMAALDVATLLPGVAASPLERELDALAIADLVARLCEGLRRDDPVALADALDRVRVEVLTQPARDLVGWPDETLLDLAARVVLNQLRAFFLLNHDICWAPFGSPALFAAAAKLEDGALGPYFSGVGRLLRSPRDVFGLIDLVSRETGGRSAHQFQRWLVLLATHLDDHARVLIADEMGDRGMTSALQGMLRAAQRTPRSGSYLFWAIRDAALDNDEPALAARAQVEITRLSRREPREWIVLAEILGTADATGAARIALAEALRLSPANEIALERMDALERGEFKRFHALSGFNSAPWRVARRAQHRSAKDIGAEIATG